MIWDSANPLAEEYVRVCNLIKRAVWGGWLNAYYNCYDYIHTGYVVLAQTTQILLNDICNEVKNRV